jgi:hypothetical protein
VNRPTKVRISLYNAPTGMQILIFNKFDGVLNS